MLKKIIIIRHGDYNKETTDLNENGKSQIRKLVPIIKENIKEYKNIFLLSSSALRGESSIQIISKGLNIPYEVSDYLWCDHNHTINMDRAANFIREKEREHNIEVIIILTHFEYVMSISERFALFNEDNFKDIVKTGEMVIIDRCSKTVSYYS